MNNEEKSQTSLPHNISIVVGMRIAEARQAMGLMVTQLANLLGVHRQTLINYESGAYDVPADKLTRVAFLLNQPLDFFYRPSLVPYFSTDTIFYRDLKKASDALRFQAASRLKWIQEYFVFLAKKIDVPALNLPDLPVVIDPLQLTTQMIEDVALIVRSHWGLGLDPIPNLVRIMERNGIVVAKMNLDIEGLDGLSCWNSNLQRPFILLNSDKASAVRSRFDAAHELGHILLHRFHDKPEYFDRKLPFYKIMEEQAHRFASALLMPEESWWGECRVVSLVRFKNLKPRWGVSINAMIRRARDLGIFGTERYQYFHKQLSNNGWRTREPFDEIIQEERPQLLYQASELLLKHGCSVNSEFSIRSENLSEITGLDVSSLKKEYIPMVLN
jgi:Zn-dependent peptidase ImmA (M78 family)/transcriptional regulator with XRE-family HTH domain